MKRVGHKGAALLAPPGNSLAAFEAAVRVGVDMLEFDVLPLDPRLPDADELVLAHDYEHLDRDAVLTLEQGLEHLASDRFAGLELDVDLKLPGYEARVCDALRRHGLVDRCLVSSQYTESLAAVRAAEPALRVGWSVPKLKRDPMQSLLTKVPALVLGLVLRQRLPGMATKALRSGQVDAMMVHWRLVTGALVRAVDAAGGELYVWTVDDAAQVARLRALGVDAIITNDPRLLAVDAEPAPARSTI